MSVKREQASSYLIRANDGFDWARIFLQGGQRADGGHWGYVSVVSVFGNFGHCFSHMANPIEQFLQHVGFDYLMGKFFGRELEEFDCEATIKHFGTLARAARRKRLLTKDEFIDVMSCLNELWSNGYRTEEQAAVYLAEKGGAFFCSTDLWEEVKKKPNPQCVGFWNDIWPLFIEQLRAESAKAAT